MLRVWSGRGVAHREVRPGPVVGRSSGRPLPGAHAPWSLPLRHHSFRARRVHKATESQSNGSAVAARSLLAFMAAFAAASALVASAFAAASSFFFARSFSSASACHQRPRRECESVQTSLRNILKTTGLTFSSRERFSSLLLTRLCSAMTARIRADRYTTTC